MGLRAGTVPDLLRGGESGPAVARERPGESLVVAIAEGEKPALPPVGERLTGSELDTICCPPRCRQESPLQRLGSCTSLCRAEL